MAYAALASLANTIDRILTSNLYSISLEEKQQITSLLKYVTPCQDSVEKFPEKMKNLEGRMREVANEAEDILEYLVLEKVFLPCDEDESESGSHLLKLKKVIKEIRLKLERVMSEFDQDFPDDEAKASLEGRIIDVVNEAVDVYRFYKWVKTHTRFRDKWRFLPPEFAKLKPKLQLIHHLNKIRNEIDSIAQEVTAIKKKKNTAAIKDDDKDDDSAAATSSSSTLGWIEDMVGLQLHDDDDDGETKFHPSAKHQDQLQLEKVIEEIALIAGQVKEIVKDDGSSGKDDVERAAADLSSSSSTTTAGKDAMVGFEDHVKELKDRLCGEPSRKLKVISICGMGGSGKTTLAKHVYEDRLIAEHFRIRLWVTISQDFSAQRFFSSLLESLKDFEAGVSGHSDDQKVYKILMGRKYLVVMDDIWSSDAWDAVRKVFPDDGEHGSRILLTTRLLDVASYPDPSSKPCEMNLLNPDQSWDLLKKKVFEDKDYSSELEKIGKEIAGNCKGLPLAIVVIAGLLVSTVSKDPTTWQGIAEKVKSAETAVHGQIEEILSLSYVELPQYLRPCFLYMGSFPEDDEIHVSRLIRLWVAEGFVKPPTDSQSFEKVAEECLEVLVKRNLVLVTKRKSDGRIKSCSLHDLMRDLCIRKAHESKFFLNIMDKHIGKEHFIESIKNQRRVSVDSSYLSYLSSSYDGSTIHSIKCSKYHLVELDFLEGARLARVLDAEAADVDPLPDQLYELFHLRYLAVRYCHGIPSALANLQNLQTLIIRREKQDKFGVGVAYGILVPWGLPQLRHVYFYGEICFDDPKETTSSLENLQTLSRVDSTCCIERVLKKIPNLKKLKIDCSGGRRDAACLNDLVHLHQLENLEVYAGRRVQSRPKYYSFTFPKSLKKLSFSYLELPWNDIIVVVASLTDLQVLKFKHCTCVGGTWETTEGAFRNLKVLVIEASRLKNWITESSHFPKLERLLLRSCWDLNEVPNDIGEIPTLQLIEVTGDVKKSLVESVEEIKKEQEELENNTLQVLCTAKSSTRGSFYSYELESAVDDDDDDDDGDDDDDDNNNEDDDVSSP